MQKHPCEEALILARVRRITLYARPKYTFLSAEKQPLIPFSEFAVHRRMYGKVSRSSILSFLSYIDHGVAAICQFVEIRRHRGS